MDKRKHELLTTNELLFTLVGCIVGAGILSLPNSIVAVAEQDGWIATIVGSLYPLYVVLVGGIIIRKYPDQNIMDVSKICLGKVLGNFLNLLFLAQFLFYAVSVIGAANNILRVYAVWFMSPLKISLVLTLLIVYANAKGLKVIAKINVLMFFIIAFLTLFSSMSLKYGSLLNVRPIFGAGLGKIVRGSAESAFSYGNMELLLVIYPYVREKKVIVKTALTATAIITLIYTWTVFAATYYLGPDIVPKSLWPFFLVSESVKIPAITSFRFIYMALWTLVLFKTAASQYYAATAVFNNLFKKMDRLYACFALSPLILVLPLLFQNEVARRNFLDKTMPWVTFFNLFYITLIAALSLLKNRKTSNNGNRKG